MKRHARLTPESCGERRRRDARLRGLIQNDLAVLDATEGKFDEAREGWRRALEADGELLLARLNRDLLEAEISLAEVHEEVGELKLVPAPGAGAGDVLGALHPAPPASSQSPVCGSLLADGSGRASSLAPRAAPAAAQGSSHHAPRDVYSVGGEETHHAERDGYFGGPAAQVRVAVLSFLFNWPSTGGGNMHTAGLVEFLKRAGYEVRHYFARYPAWGIGRVAGGWAGRERGTGI